MDGEGPRKVSHKEPENFFTGNSDHVIIIYSPYQRQGIKRHRVYSTAPEFECLDCLQKFWKLSDAEAHPCPTPRGSQEDPILLDPTPNGRSTQTTPTGSPPPQWCSTVFPDLGPLTNDGDSGRVFQITNDFSDTSAMMSYMADRSNFGHPIATTTYRCYGFDPLKFPGLIPDQTEWVLYSACSVRLPGAEGVEARTLYLSSTLTGPMIVLHRLITFLGREALKFGSRNNRLAYETAREDLESAMCLSLELSDTRSQEVAWLMRFISVPLPPSSALGCYLVSLSAQGLLVVR